MLARAAAREIRITALVLAAAGCSSGEPIPAHSEPSMRGGERGVRFTDQRLTVDGAPVLPFGILWREAGAAIATYADHHLNVFLTNRSRNELREARAAGIYTLAGYHGAESARRLADEPTLLAWFIADDADSDEDLARARVAIDAIRAVDTHRPIFANLIGHTPERNAPFAEILDVASPYRYPFPLETLSWYRDYLAPLHAATGHRAFWTTIQSSGIYSKHRQSLGLSDPDMRRFLGPAQLRLLVWTALQLGARGIFFWPEHGFFDGSPYARERALEVARLGMELEVWGDVLVMGDAVADVEARADGPVAAAAVRWGEEVLVLVNADPPDAGRVTGAAALDAVTVVVEDPGWDAADASAYRVSMSDLHPLDVRVTGRKIEIAIDRVDVADAVIVTAADPTRIRRRIEERRAEYGSTLAESFALEGTGAARAFEEITRLGYGRDVVPLPETSPSDIESLRRARADLRRALATVQRRAAARRHDAAPGAENLWMSSHTLPGFYASLMETSPAE